MKTRNKQSEVAPLRRKAEEALKKKSPKISVKYSDAEMRALVHELQVHQIELEMQNEELILAKKKAEDASDKYANLYNFAALGYFTLSREGEIVDVNIAGAQMLGKERGHLIKSRFALFVSDDTRSVFSQFVAKVLVGNAKEDCDVNLSPKIGRLAYVHLTGIASNDGKQCHITAVDITEQKLATEALQQEKNILSTFIEYSPAAIAMFDNEMRYIAASRRYIIDYDLNVESVIGRSHYEIFPEIPERWKEIHRRCLAGATEKCEEDPFPRVSGKLDYVQWEIRPWYSRSDEIGGIILFSEIITERKKAEEIISESEERFRSLASSFNDVVYTLDTRQCHTGVYGDWVEKAGFTPEFFLGKPAREIVGVEAARIHEEANRHALAGVPMVYEWSAPVGGEILFFQTSVSPLRNSQGEIVGIVGVGRDITGHKYAEKTLRESEEKWRMLVTTIPDYIGLFDTEGRYIYLNHYAEGFSENNVLGKNMFDFIEKESITVYRKHFDDCIAYRQTQHFTYSAYGEKADIKIYDGYLIPIIDNNTVINVLSVAKDVTEQKRAENILIENEMKLRELAERLQTIREEERNRIAHELHDDLGQSITGIKLEILLLEKSISGSLPEGLRAKTKNKVEEIASLIDSMIVSIRNICSELRPAVLDKLGFVAALEWQVEVFQKKTGIVCDLDVLTENTIEKKNKIIFFRIFQETLTNVIRHAQASRVSVTYGRQRNNIVLTVHDNGIGITEEQAEGNKSLGLIGIKERAASLRGKVEITGVKGKGTTVIITIPCALSGSN